MRSTAGSMIAWSGNALPTNSLTSSLPWLVGQVTCAFGQKMTVHYPSFGGLYAPFEFCSSRSRSAMVMMIAR